MNARHALLGAAAAAALVLSSLVGAAAPARAGTGPGPGFDRQISEPTGWWSYSALTTSQLSAKLTANHARLTDLQVRSTSPLTFVATMVADSGDFATKWWWGGALSKAGYEAALAKHHARLISIQRYTGAGGHTAYAAVMVQNTGVNKTAWWLAQGTHSSISHALATHHARLIQLTPYSSTAYTALMVSNTGPQKVSSTSSWHKSGSSISNTLSKNHYRLIDLSRNSDGTFNAVMYANPAGTTWYWRTKDTSIQALIADANQWGQRIIDVTRYTFGGTVYYAGVMIDDLNALSRQLAAQMAAVVHSGHYGFYFRRVDGAVSASLESNLPFEPASAIKVLYHLRTIESEAAGTAHDNTSITYHYDPASPDNAGICPEDFSATKKTNLKNADTLMMQNSDNRMTRGVREHFGKPAMLALAKSLHMSSTQIHHTIGCPTATTHNLTTLVDLDQIYNGFASGHLVTNSTWRQAFTDRMLNDSVYPSFKSGFCPIVNQEAAKLGKSRTVATNFCNAVLWYAKGGSYTYGGSWPANISYAGMSVTRLPILKKGQLLPNYRDYIYGHFEDEVTIHSDSQQTAVGALGSSVYYAAIRPAIDSALKTWT
jgi:Beta-lactamase enzyme family